MDWLNIFANVCIAGGFALLAYFFYLTAQP